MKAVYYENGGPDVIRYEEVPDPQCGADEVLIRVEAISVEGGDLLHRFASPPSTRPHIVGYSAAGEILELGRDVDGFGIGQKVVTFGAAGSHAALRVAKKIHCWPIPEGLDVGTAAGRTACGLPRWAEGYSSGLSLGDSSFFGRQAGRQAAMHRR